VKTDFVATPVQNEIEVFLEPYGLHRLELQL